MATSCSGSCAGSEVYFTGGATAVLLGWRASTIDIDLKLEGGADSVLRAIPRIKEDLQVNVELAAPDDFVPALPGWRDRCLFVRREGPLDFLHYDLYGQTLAKIERAHELDPKDVREMIDRRHVVLETALDRFRRVEGKLYRYPAVDPALQRRRVEEVLGGG
jgi:hypothetical protein